MSGGKKKAVWTLVFLALVGLTIFTIVRQSEDFSIRGFAKYVSGASIQWIILAFVSMLGFIVFEALAIIILAKAFGYKRKLKRGIIYSSTDIYFSAITPSATGGQPASAYFMMKDKIPGAVTTIILLTNLTLYTISIIVIGIVCFLARPGIFARFSIVSQCMITVGFLLQFVLLAAFILLVYKEKIVMKIADAGMKILGKLHLMHNIEKRREHLKQVEKQYKECANAIKNHKKSILAAFCCNLLQRISQIMVSVCVFIGIGGSVSQIFDVFATQGYVVMGSNSMPIPGAVGAADYLFIDGFEGLVEDTVSMELLSRGISFYCCIIICGIITLAIYTSQGLKGMKQKKKC